MKRADKALWLTALRSGEYIQGIGCLQKLEFRLIKNCCLGVLCRAFNVPEVKNEHTNRYSFYGAENYLPQIVKEQFGFEHVNPSLKLGFTDKTGLDFVLLGNLNDEGFTFEQIADMIEYFLETED